MCIAYGGKIRIQPPGVWQISYTFHRHTNKLEGTTSVALYIPLVTFDINEGVEGRQFWDRWSSGSGLAFWGGLVQRMPIVARLVYNLDHTDSGNPGS